MNEHTRPDAVDHKTGMIKVRWLSQTIGQVRVPTRLVGKPAVGLVLWFPQTGDCQLTIPMTPLMMALTNAVFNLAAELGGIHSILQAAMQEVSKVKEKES